jgi:DNA replication and repair protein RecF
MPFERVCFSSFRNLKDGEVSVGADRVFLVGENGQGKTNFLEALYFLSYGASFRGKVDAEVAQKGSKGFSVSGSVRAATGTLPFEDLRVSWDEGVKCIKRNDKPVKDRKELIEINPSIVFCHEDFSFAAGEPERRRFFFDQAAGLVSVGYIDSLREYKRILKQRNASLKAGRGDILPLLDMQLAARGMELMRTRTRLRTEFDERFCPRFEEVSLRGRPVGIRYSPNWPIDLPLEGILERLESRRLDELALGTSLSGPHRDRWGFVSDDGSDYSATASTGQLRLLSLVLRMVQAEYYRSETGRLPVLLLDDVLLELDKERRKRFLRLLPPASQAFFTFLPGEDWGEYYTDSTMVYEVHDGRFQD